MLNWLVSKPQTFENQLKDRRFSYRESGVFTIDNRAFPLSKLWGSPEILTNRLFSGKMSGNRCAHDIGVF